jgi:hypothetical protein
VLNPCRVGQRDAPSSLTQDGIVHPRTPHEITALTDWTHTTPPAPHPAMLPAELPPGVEVVTLPNGIRTLTYLHPTPATTPPSPLAAAPQPVPTWAKTTALLTPTIGTGLAGAGVGISYAAPGLIAMSHALWAAVALIATGSAAGIALLNRARATATARRAPTQITQNITATGLFGRANGTIHHH